MQLQKNKKNKNYIGKNKILFAFEKCFAKEFLNLGFFIFIILIGFGVFFVFFIGFGSTI